MSTSNIFSPEYLPFGYDDEEVATMDSIKTYEIFYAADPFNVHATIKASNSANARNAVQRMMEDGEAFGMDLSYREAKRCTCSPRQLEQVGCDCKWA